jgi:Flp pilus assembly protein TadG
MEHRHGKPSRRWLALRRLRRGRERGQSLVEISLLLPLFLVIIVGLIEIADAMNAYITVTDAARDGARLGSKGASDDAVRALVGVETARLRDPVDTNADVTINHITLSGVDAIEVKVCNQRTLILDVPLVMPDNFDMCSTTTMRKLPPPP